MLDLLFEDDQLRVYDKPANVSLLRDRSGEPDLWQAIQAAWAERGEKPYLVHRLDKGTSGVLLVARRQAVQADLTRAFAARTVRKFYVARVAGRFPAGGTMRIALPLCKGRKSRYRVAGQREQIRRQANTYSVHQDRDGVAAVTLARTLRSTRETSLVLLQPLTGRTHQLRVHLSWLGFPILGDHLYGQPRSPRQSAERLMLHCHRLLVPGWQRFSAPLPPAFAA